MMAKHFYRTVLLFFLIVPVVSVADSTHVAPLSSPNIKYPSATSLAPPNGITNNNYATVVPKLCDTVNVAHCPTINDKSPRALGLSKAVMDQDCPEYCRAERKLGGASWLRTTVDAVCPRGYASVAQFNSQTDFTYSTTSVTQYPKTVELYNCYNGNGYLCNFSPTMKLYQQDPDNCEKNVWLYDIGDIVDNIPGVNQAAKIVTRGQICLGSACIFCYYGYVTSYCTGVGMIPTCTTTIPTVLICARIAPQWNQH